jgi:FkbM family methyltransferase
MPIFKKIVLNTLENFGIKLIPTSFYSYLVSPTVIELLDRYKIECDSVLHIGGHLAEEASLYSNGRISKATFIEGDPETFQDMSEVLGQYPGYLGIKAMLSSEKSITKFYVASNLGASSSILAPRRHLTERPDIKFHTIKEIETVTLDSLNLGIFDLVVLDVQGAELKVIQGGLETINAARAIWVEVNTGAMYEGDANSSEIVLSLAEHFVVVYMNMSENKWGDALFIRKSLVQLDDHIPATN